MAHTLSFAQRNNYPNNADLQEINLPVILTNGVKTTKLRALLDTGSPYCIFHPIHARSLSLEVKDGQLQTFRTFNNPSGFKAYGHALILDVFGFRFDSIVYFFIDENVKEKNFLGRIGWLNKVRLGLIHYDREMYLSDYND